MRDGGSRLNDFESMGGGKVEEVKLWAVPEYSL